MNYKKWLSYESKWMKGYRKKMMRQMKYQTTPIVVIALGFIMVIQNFGRPAEIMVEYFIGGVIGGLVLMGFALLFMSIGLSGKRVTKGIETAVKEIGMAEAEKEVMAKELYNAETQRSSYLSFQMSGPGARDTPADITVSEHYVMMKGGTPLGQIIRLSDVDHVKVGEEKRSTTEYGGKTKTTTFFTLYTILFAGKTKALRGFGFLDRSIRDKAFAMIEKQLPFTR